MGLDFIRQKAKGFQKHWDGGRAALAEPDLIEGETEFDQHVLFDVYDGATVAEGEELLVQVDGSTLVAARGNEVVATAAHPPENVLAGMRGARSYVMARVARYSDISKTADLAFRMR